jgi:SAM-dependent methyltransferase
MPTIAVDLGCGARPKNPFNADIVYGIDVRDDLENKVVKADLVIDKIPFEDNFFDFVTAHDFIEHIPRLIYAPTRRLPFVELMNEAWRVLKPGGIFYSHTPAVPQLAAFWDPTHVNFITEHTFPMYFDDINIIARMYGFTGAFSIKSQHWMETHLVSTLIKTTPKF